MEMISSNLEKYWVKYTDNVGNDVAEDYYIGGDYYTSGYICPHCGAWINYGSSHVCCTIGYPRVSYCYPQENKTEKAYNILKILVKEEIIKQPKTFKKFCDLVEGIAKVV